MSTAHPKRLARAYDIGLSGGHLMEFKACEDCGNERWVVSSRPARWCRACSAARNNAPRPKQSESQRGEKNRMWKGGRTKGGNGYIYELVQPGDPLRPMANKTGYAMQHRLVMARAIRRLIGKREQVHHLNGIRTDNRIENLELWKLSHPSGVRTADYHCPGCRCGEVD